jgi:hypothetical protein
MVGMPKYCFEVEKIEKAGVSGMSQMFVMTAEVHYLLLIL